MRAISIREVRKNGRTRIVRKRWSEEETERFLDSINRTYLRLVQDEKSPTQDEINFVREIVFTI